MELMDHRGILPGSCPTAGRVIGGTLPATSATIVIQEKKRCQAATSTSLGVIIGLFISTTELGLPGIQSCSFRYQHQQHAGNENIECYS